MMLLQRVSWEMAVKNKGMQGRMDLLKERNLEGSGAGCPHGAKEPVVSSSIRETNFSLTLAPGSWSCHRSGTFSLHWSPSGRWKGRGEFLKMFFRLGYYIIKAWNTDGNLQSGSSEKPCGSCSGLIGPLPGFDIMLPGFWELFYTATITIKREPKIHKLQSLLY